MFISCRSCYVLCSFHVFILPFSFNIGLTEFKPQENKIQAELYIIHIFIFISIKKNHVEDQVILKPVNIIAVAWNFLVILEQ